MSLVSGHSRERAAAIARIRSEIRSGVKFAFCYSESSTMPYALTDPHHLPSHGEMDLRFFRKLAGVGVPVGVFYRDAQWRLPAPGLGFLGKAKRRAALWFYRREWRTIQEVATKVFVPSAEFGRWMESEGECRWQELPPGCLLHHGARPAARKYAMAYVGGILGPIYDISPYVELAARLPELRFLLVCRESEWKTWQGRGSLPPNMELRFAQGEGLDALLDEASLFSLLVKPSEYFSIAMPVKLFDAMGRDLPLVASAGTAAAAFVAREGLGWVVASAEEAASLVTRLCAPGGSELAAAEARVAKVAGRHTWRRRAAAVAEELGKP